MTVAALQGECLDALVWRAVGRGAAAADLVLAANPGIAARAHALAEGELVTIPDLPGAASPEPLVQLWD